MIIDFHTHVFPDKIAAAAVASLAEKSHTRYFTDGTLTGLCSSMEKAGVSYSVNLPVMTAPAQCNKVNDSMMRERESMLRRGIIPFGGMHPDYEGYRQKLKELSSAGIPGIKLHPAYQNTDLNDIRYLRIIDAANELGLVVLIHAGIDVGIPGHDFADTKMILQVIREIAPAKFVLAHMGGWNCWEDVERDLAGAPVYLDTAFSLGKITPHPDSKEEPCSLYNLSAEAFLRLSRKHGMDKVLFATDSPWEEQKDYIERVNRLPLTEDEKEKLFHSNAEKLLHL